MNRNLHFLAVVAFAFAAIFAVVDEMAFIGSAYAISSGNSAGNVLLAFGVDQGIGGNEDVSRSWGEP